MKNKFIKLSIISSCMVCALAACHEDKKECETHTFDAGVITKEATSTEEGLKTYTCIACGATKTESIPVLSDCEHSWNAGIVTTPATENADGVKTYTCSKCGVTKTESIPKNTPAEKFTVTYNGNGGSGDEVVDLNEYNSGDKVTVKGNSFTAPEGKEFNLWNDEPDMSGTYYKPGNSFKIYENVTLYAEWLDKQEPIIVDDETTEHVIKVNCPTGVSYTLSTNKALKDTKVTLSISLSGGNTLKGNPTSPQVVLTKTSELNYEFTMPATAVTIDIKVTIDGDVVLTGDVSGKLTDADGDGIYSADFTLNEKSRYGFSYVVKDSNGDAKTLSSLKLDETRCDADITFANKSSGNELSIAGGATYTFCYDSNDSDYNCFVVRKSVDTLPSNSNNLYKLFDGKMRSQSTIHPQGLTGIKYVKTVDGNDATLGYKVTNEEYTYNKLSDTESFAVSIDKLNNNKPSYVYKNIDKTHEVYSIVNTYVKTSGSGSSVLGNNEADDNVWNLDPYGETQGERFFPYSARQDIVDNSKYNDTTRYQISEREAYRNVSMAAHYGSVLEYEIYQSLRGDFDGTATINAANPEGSHIKVTSTKRSGGFQTVVESQLEYNHEESGSTADVTQQYAFVYNVTMIFKSNGDLYSMNYVEKYYTKDNWNFAKHEASGNAITTTITVNNEFDKTYDRATVLGTFNPDDYFISSIEGLSFDDPAIKEEDKTSNVSNLNYNASLDIIPYLGGGEKAATVDEFKYYPETALDAWQYGCVNSSDPSVIGETPWGMKAIGVGTAVATFGNHLENLPGPTKDVTIAVFAGGTFGSLFINGNMQGYDSFSCRHAQYIDGYAGKTMNFYIDSGTNTGCPVSYYVVIEVTNSKGQKANVASVPEFNIVNGVGTEYDEEDQREYTKIVGNVLTIDFNTEAANALTSTKSYTLYFCSKFYEPGRMPSTFQIFINPALNSVANSKFKSDAYYYKDDGVTLSDKIAESSLIEFGANGTGKITQKLFTESGDVEGINTYNFSYTEMNNGTINASLTSVSVVEGSVLPRNAGSYTLVIERQPDGSIAIGLYTDDYDIYGECDVDDEGFPILENLVLFEKVGA